MGKSDDQKAKDQAFKEFIQAKTRQERDAAQARAKEAQKRIDEAKRPS